MDSASRHSGLSTLEIVVALLIVTFTLGVSVPQVNALLTAWRVRLEARFLAESIEEFSIASQLRGKQVLFAIEPELFHVHWISIGGETLREHKFASGVTFQDATGPQPLTLYPSGALTPTTLTLEMANRSCSIKVALRGRTSISCNEV